MSFTFLNKSKHVFCHLLDQTIPQCNLSSLLLQIEDLRFYEKSVNLFRFAFFHISHLTLPDWLTNRRFVRHLTLSSKVLKAMFNLRFVNPWDEKPLPLLQIPDLYVWDVILTLTNLGFVTLLQIPESTTPYTLSSLQILTWHLTHTNLGFVTKRVSWPFVRCWIEDDL